MKKGIKCVCGTKLRGKQIKYCSRKCRFKTNSSYPSQKKRGIMRKLELVKRFGGACPCGYNKNLAALEFHHNDPSTKRFQLDLRSLSNRSMEEIEKEVRKCALVCSNCHTELEHPHLSL